MVTEIYEEYHLNQILDNLSGPSKEQIIVFNQWAAVALNKFHENSKTLFSFNLNGNKSEYILNWNSDFSQDAMREKKTLAENGGISLAMFVMSVLSDYKYMHQSEIGAGTDYGFKKSKPTSENFLDDCHYIEVSGILEEKGVNTLLNRVQIKHRQIEKGSNRDKTSSIIVTLFNDALTHQEKHK